MTGWPIPPVVSPHVQAAALQAAFLGYTINVIMRWGEKPRFEAVSRYAEGSAVEVRYPLTPDQDREEWPWLPGTLLERCGPDEWRVRVDAPELEEDGTFPVVFRDASELKPAPVSAFWCPCCGDDIFGTPPRSALTAVRRAVSRARTPAETGLV